MAYSFISYKDNHVRAHDFDLTFFAFIFMSAANDVHLKIFFDEMFSAWVASIKYGGSGCLDFDLDGFLISKERLGAFVKVFDATKGWVDAMPEEISLRSLRDLVNIENFGSANYKKKFISDLMNVLENDLVGKMRSSL